GNVPMPYLIRTLCKKKHLHRIDYIARTRDEGLKNHKSLVLKAFYHTTIVFTWLLTLTARLHALPVNKTLNPSSGTQERYTTKSYSNSEIAEHQALESVSGHSGKARTGSILARIQNKQLKRFV
ncbi:MAG: hypothetical protein NZ526_07985, partial [Aquificaceae bacterium]|nr:hypothetical protein [Aquificaceae bacterium]